MMVGSNNRLKLLPVLCGWLALLAVAVLMGACLPARGGSALEIHGVVVSAETGEPLARIPVGAVSKGALRGLPEDATVRPQAKTVTNNLGEFSLVSSQFAGGAGEFYVFTTDPLYRNMASGGVKLDGQLPLRKELTSARPVSIGNAAALEFRLALALEVKDGLRIPMRDGAELAATLVLPKGGSAHPAILMRTPYGRDSTRDYIALAREGYAFVAQDMRGRFDSEGDNLAFVNDGWGELRDGYDTVKWIAAQEWCDGRVGTIGASALGIAQNMLAGAAPPSLKAQVIIVAAASIYHDAAYVGGVLRESQVEDWLSSNEWDPENLRLMREHPFYDDYWRMLDLTTRAKVAFPPALYFGGWYDTFAEGTLRGYDLRRHRAPNGSPGDTYLVMGPWTHGTMFDAATGGIELPPQAAGDFIPDVIAFFDYYLKGEDNGFAKRYPRVQYYATGSLVGRNAPGNSWVTADDFPPEAEEATMFLAPEGRLESTLPEVSKHSVKLTFDPSSPVPTKGGRNLTIPAGPADQRDVEQRTDVISFTSDKLSRPMPIVGLVTAQIAMAVDAPDADISVRLSDVYPDGTSFLILDGIARMSLPYPYTTPRKVTPGEFYRIPVELGHTAYVVDAGHKLRVALAASNHPRFELNPTLAAMDNPVDLRISLGGDMPSSLHFPVCAGLLNDG